VTQWLIEEAAFAALDLQNMEPAHSSDPEVAEWERHREFLERSMGRA